MNIKELYKYKLMWKEIKEHSWFSPEDFEAIERRYGLREYGDRLEALVRESAMAYVKLIRHIEEIVREIRKGERNE